MGWLGKANKGPAKDPPLCSRAEFKRLHHERARQRAEQGEGVNT